MNNRNSSDDLKRRPERNGGRSTRSSQNDMKYMPKTRSARPAPSDRQVYRPGSYEQNVQHTNANSNAHRYSASDEISSSSRRGRNTASASAKRRCATVGGRKSKYNVKLIVTNIILSLVFIFSSVTFVGASMLNWQLVKKDNIDSKEKDNFENIVVSPDANVAYFLVAGVDLSENLTDVIMVVCYDLANNQANVLQIPRDTFITSGDNRVNSSNKVNAVYGNARSGESKIKALIRCINQKFGLPIDHYATVTIKGTEKIIDIAGGVDIKLDKDLHLVDDTTKPQQKKTFEAGNVHLDGQWGTAFVRHRASYVQGDLGREKAQRKFYAAFMKKMISLDFGQITQIVTKASNEISTDLTLGEMLGYAQKMKGMKLENVKIMSVPGQSAWYNGYSFYSVHKADLVKMLNADFLPYDEDGVKSSELGITELHSTYQTGYDEFLEGGSLDDFDTQADKTKTTAAKGQ